MALVTITPAIPQMLAHFPETNPVLVKAMVTIPSICIILVSAVSGWLASFVRKKTIVLIGLVFYFLGGFGGYFASSILQMVISRLVLGVGLGMLMPMTTGLVADFYSGMERTKMIGYSQAVNYFGGVAATLLAGVIAVFNWRNVFLIYLFSLLVLLVVAFFLPEPERKGTARSKLVVLPKAVYLLGLGALLQMVVFYSAVTNVSIKLTEIGISNTYTSSVGICILYLGCFLSGTILTKILDFLKRFTMPAAVAMTALGFVFMGVAGNEIVLFVGIALVGVADGVIIPYIYALAARHSPREASGQAMATIVSFISIGQFLSPLAFQVIINLIGLGTIASGYIGMGALLFVFTAFALAKVLMPPGIISSRISDSGTEQK